MEAVDQSLSLYRLHGCRLCAAAMPARVEALITLGSIDASRSLHELEAFHVLPLGQAAALPGTC